MEKVFTFYPGGKDSDCRAVKKYDIIYMLRKEKDMSYYLGKIAIMLGSSRGNSALGAVNG